MTTSIDETLLDSIVAGVLSRLSGTTAPEPVAVKLRTTPQDPEKEVTPFSLTDRVITESLLDSKLNGARTVLFSPKAVLTPTARDYLRIHKIEWRIADRGAKSASAVAHKSHLAIVVAAGSATDRALGDVLPHVRRELLGCPDDAASLAIAELSRGGVTNAIIFAQQTHRTACLANRHHSVKAVAIRDAADVSSVKRQLRANCFCLDPTGRTYFELRNILKNIVSS